MTTEAPSAEPGAQTGENVLSAALPKFGKLRNPPRPPEEPSAENVPHRQTMGSTRDTSPFNADPGAVGDEIPEDVVEGLARVFASGIALAAVITAAVLRRFAHRDLRPPTHEQRAAIAAPLARLVARHTPLTGIESGIAADVADLVDASAGMFAYASTAPLARLDPDDAIPAPLAS